MKINFLKMILPLMLVIIMAGCAGIKVSSDYDRKADFAKYKTFNFSKEVDKVTLNDLNRRRLKDAISKEMEAKGFILSASNIPSLNLALNNLATAVSNSATFNKPCCMAGMIAPT